MFFGKNLLKIDKQVTLNGIILGLLFGAGFLLQTIGLKYTSVAKSAFITGITVIFTPFVYWLIERKKINFWQIGGVVIVTIGLWLFINPKFDNLNIGDMLTLFSTLFWAFYITYMDVFTRGRSSKTETTQLVIFQLIAAAPISILYCALFELSNIKLVWSTGLLVSLAYNGIIASFLLTFIHTSVQRFTNPVKASLIFSLEPVFASILAVIFLKEIMYISEITGAVILMAGVLLSKVGDFQFKGSFLNK
jgi:drug/metabolite transporter (DMT)-like permease